MDDVVTGLVKAAGALMIFTLSCIVLGSMWLVGKALSIGESPFRFVARQATKFAAKAKNATTAVASVAVASVPAAYAATAPALSLKSPKESASAPKVHNLVWADSFSVVTLGDEWSITCRFFAEAQKVTRHLRCTSHDFIDEFREVYKRSTLDIGDVAYGDLDLILEQAQSDGIKALEAAMREIQARRDKIKEEFPPIEEVASSPVEVAVVAETVTEQALTPVLVQESSTVAQAPVPQVVSEALEATKPSQWDYRAEGEVAFADMAQGLIGNTKVFTVELQTEKGPKKFRGVELKVECEKLGIQVGDRIAIASKKSNASGRSKNLFEVTRA